MKESDSDEDEDDFFSLISRNENPLETENQSQETCAANSGLQPSSKHQSSSFQISEVDFRKMNEQIDHDEIKVDCLTSCNFFLRRFSNIREAASGSRVSDKQIKECCSKNEESTDILTAKTAFGFIFRYVVENSMTSVRASSSSSISNLKYENRILLSISNDSRRQVEVCVIKAMKTLRLGRIKSDSDVFKPSSAINCMGADGAFMRRFTDLYHVARTLNLDTASLYKNLQTNNTLLEGFSWHYYQGDDDPHGPGVGEVLLFQ